MALMSNELRIPDLGDIEDVSVIEILVAVGDSVEAGDSLLVLESEKATMDVPAEQAGTIVGLSVAVGDKVRSGDVIGSLDAAASAASSASPPAASTTHPYSSSELFNPALNSKPVKFDGFKPGIVNRYYARGLKLCILFTLNPLNFSIKIRKIILVLNFSVFIIFQDFTIIVWPYMS